MNNGDIVRELNALVRLCMDSEQGFLACADMAGSRALRDLFCGRAADCRRSAAALQAAVLGLDGAPAHAGSAVGNMHQGWWHLRTAVFGCTDLALLDECADSEEAALWRYQVALSVSLPEPAHEVVRRQYEGLKRHHGYLCGMRERLRGPAPSPEA